MPHTLIPAAQAASLPLAPRTPPAAGILVAAEHLLSHLEQDCLVDAARLRNAMAAAFSASARTSRPTCQPAEMPSFPLQARGRGVFTAAIAGSVYAKHGTAIETRLTVIDDDWIHGPAAA